MEYIWSMSPVTALVYQDRATIDRTLRDLVRDLRARGLRLAGVVQRDVARADRRRCDMILESLSGGEPILISQDRGPHARGCRLVVHELLKAMQMVAAALETAPDVLILNKFGKTEAEGGGFRDLIAKAMELGIPVLVGVPRRNLEAWRDYAGSLGTEIDLDTDQPAWEPSASTVSLAALGMCRNAAHTTEEMTHSAARP